MALVVSRSLPNPRHLLTPIGVPERGLVVTIYLDPRYPNHSTAAELERLQNGDYGPFYRP